MNLDTAIFLIGFIIGIILSTIYFKTRYKNAGELVADESDPDVDRYSIILSIPFDEIPKRKRISLKIRSGVRKENSSYNETY